jgi:hypothetical protein
VEPNDAFATFTESEARLAISAPRQLRASDAFMPALLWLVWTTIVIVGSIAAARTIGWERLFGGRIGASMVNVDATLSVVGALAAFTNMVAAGRRRSSATFDRNAACFFLDAAPICRLSDIDAISIQYRFADGKTRLIRLVVSIHGGPSCEICATSQDMRPLPETAAIQDCDDYAPNAVLNIAWLPYAGEPCGLGPAEIALLDIAGRIAAYLGLPAPPSLPSPGD